VHAHRKQNGKSPKPKRRKEHYREGYWAPENYVNPEWPIQSSSPIPSSPETDEQRYDSDSDVSDVPSGPPRFESTQSPPLSRPFIEPNYECPVGVPNVSSRQTIHTYGKTPISRHDLNSLLPETARSGDGMAMYLNDEVIMATLTSLCEAANKKYAATQAAAGRPLTDGIPRYHTLNTIWWSKASHNVSQTGRWLTRAGAGGAKFLCVHKLFIPIHNNAHWMMVIVYPQTKKIEFYDSLGNGPHINKYIDKVFDFLEQELKNTPLPLVRSEWTAEYGATSRQVNGYDCGVYSLTNAWSSFYIDEPSLIIPSEEQTATRQTLLHLLLSGGFVNDGPFDLEKYYPGFHLEKDMPS